MQLLVATVLADNDPGPAVYYMGVVGRPSWEAEVSRSTHYPSGTADTSEQP